MDQAGVERADADNFLAHDPVLSVEEEHAEVLLFLFRKALHCSATAVGLSTESGRGVTDRFWLTYAWALSLASASLLAVNW
jgi:hypothetical protein